MHFHFLFKAKLSTASLNTLLLKQLIVAYGARMRGSVFKIIFLFFAGEFDSIETSPGFAQYLELCTLS